MDDLETTVPGKWKSALATLNYVRCRRCKSIVAVDIRRTLSALDNAYPDMAETYWNNLALPRQFAAEIEKAIASRISAGSTIVDVGCGNGSLMAHLARSWQVKGIEPGRFAVAAACARGLEVTQGTASGLEHDQVCDAVVSVDVLEHLLDPIIEIRAMHRMLRPGGFIFIVTGDASRATARVAGEEWYYLQCAGHVTVMSRKALRTLLKAAGFHPVETRGIEHAASSGAVRWLRALARSSARRLGGASSTHFPYYRDHQLVIAQKPKG